MRGYHYTSWENWERIREEGLKPYPIKNPSFKDEFPPGTQAIFTWQERLTGLDHYGQIIWVMIHQHTLCPVLLSYEYETFEAYPGNGGLWVLRHNGTLGTNYGEPWVYHKDVPAVLVTRPVAPERLTLEAVYDLKGMVDERDHPQLCHLPAEVDPGVGRWIPRLHSPARIRCLSVLRRNAGRGAGKSAGTVRVDGTGRRGRDRKRGLARAQRPRLD